MRAVIAIIRSNVEMGQMQFDDWFATATEGRLKLVPTPVSATARRASLDREPALGVMWSGLHNGAVRSLLDATVAAVGLTEPP